MDATFDESRKLKFARAVVTTSTAISCPNQSDYPIAREFGWYWEITDDIAFSTNDLHRQNQIFNVWETPQFRAVEWLVGQRKLRFPPTMDAGLHGTFLKILGIYALCINPVRHGDIVDAIERIDSASKKVVSAADDLFGIEPEVVDFLTDGPVQSALSVEHLNHASGSLSLQLGLMKGVLMATLKMQNEMYVRFTGKSPTEISGRPSNWVARFVAIQAADIYRTAFAGPITPSVGRPSFVTFLERFSQGIPDAERADKRALARKVWKEGYSGVPFAPVA